MHLLRLLRLLLIRSTHRILTSFSNTSASGRSRRCWEYYGPACSIFCPFFAPYLWRSSHWWWSPCHPIRSPYLMLITIINKFLLNLIARDGEVQMKITIRLMFGYVSWLDWLLMYLCLLFYWRLRCWWWWRLEFCLDCLLFLWFVLRFGLFISQICLSHRCCFLLVMLACRWLVSASVTHRMPCFCGRLYRGWSGYWLGWENFYLKESSPRISCEGGRR